MPRSQLRFCLEPIRQALLYPSGIMKSLSWELELEAEQKNHQANMVMSTCVSTKKCYATSLVFRKFRCMVRYLDEGFFEKHFCCSNVLPNFITFRTEAKFQSAWPIALVMSGPSFMHRIKIPIEMEVRQKTDPGDFRQKIVPGQPGLKMKHEKTDELP